MRETAILILAAGESRRMGRPKQTLPVGGQALLASVIKECLAAEIGPVYLVSGAYESQVREIVPADQVTLVYNPDWQEGMGKSLATGVEAISAHEMVDRVLLVLGDQYKLTASVLNEFCETFSRSGTSIGISTFEGGSGPPAIFERKWFEELKKLTGDEGAKPLVRANQTEVLRISVPAAAADLDTPEEYRRLSQP